MKKAFSLILAIIFIVLLATIGMLSFGVSATGVKQTDNLYLSEQAKLIAKSATEHAIMKIQQCDFSDSRLIKIVKDYPKSGDDYLLKSTVYVTYIGVNLPTTCKEKINDENPKNSTCNSWIDSGATKDRNGLDINGKTLIQAVILDTVVESNPAANTEVIRYSRTTTQKP
ncbi:hypothetical protein CIG11343_1080 [Campylobacter iguaniorum]|uniref:hypothetical protein n=1 Tax=Campylobacter iguaniorum TaxID=1244531 RepID=UPI0007C8E151|nr:hypothetical protein [Campylobacter iguaniorum]ANE36094.1 hypothetical protein CIG11343_1080 [Campylobacter iguaniorum]